MQVCGMSAFFCAGLPGAFGHARIDMLTPSRVRARDVEASKLVCLWLVERVLPGKAVPVLACMG